MIRQITLLAAAALVTASTLEAGELEIREHNVRNLASGESRATAPDPPTRTIQSTDTATESAPQTPTERLAVYPVPGEFGSEVFIPYFVDLLPGAGVRDYNCNRFAFEEHDGHDPYIRSFREQEIGVPVFAPMDGVVIALRDGEPDQNTESDPAFVSNFVRLRHINGLTSDYVHLKRDSITVDVGDLVTAGTQIGMVGSSGPSTGPHVHFSLMRHGEPIEPLSGPCRQGESWFDEQPPVWEGPVVMGGQLSNQSFANFRPAPFDDAPRTGTFLAGARTIYFKAEMANIRAGADYQILLEAPNGSTSAASGTFERAAELVSSSWELDTHLNQFGTWKIILVIDGERVKEAPFTVVSSAAEIVNRTPSPISAMLLPTTLNSGNVPQCRVETELPADPDYDVVSYQYEWQVDGETVRSLTSAATSDALPRQYARRGSVISCSVTATDGSLSTPTVTAHTTVQGIPRMRGVRR